MLKAMMMNVVQEAMYYFIEQYGLPLCSLNVKIKVHPSILDLTEDIWQTLSLTFPSLHLLIDVYETPSLEEKLLEIICICETVL